VRFRVLFAGALPGLDGEEGGQVWIAVANTSVAGA
jgi:hypothetical protein